LAYVQQLLKGLIDPIILSVASRFPVYGYQLIRELERSSGGGLRLKAGTVYPSLLRLEKNGLLISKLEQITGGRKRRYYEITEKGRQFLANRLVEWHNFSVMVSRLMLGNNLATES
jgi:PadR family transcriptional regulator PadR